MSTTKQLQERTAGLAIDQVPEGHELGGVKPKVRNVVELSLALRVISWICSRRQTVNAVLEQKINLFREQAKADLQLIVDEQTLTFDEREQALRDAVSKFVKAKRAEVFDGKTKTAKFPCGTVALKDKAASLLYAEDVTKRTIVERLLEDHELLCKAVKWLKRLGLLPWLKISFDLDVAAISKAVKEGSLTSEDLAEMGLRWEGDEIVVITPADYRAAADGPAAT